VKAEGEKLMTMKLVVAIVSNEDADDLLDGLVQSDYRATRLASTGGFLRQGNTTIIVGVPENSVNDVVNIIAAHSHGQKKSFTNPFPDPGTVVSQQKEANLVDSFIAESLTGGKPTIQTGRATVFVLNLERYERI
jgi:uncharacterized protein YaaQ